MSHPLPATTTVVGDPIAVRGPELPASLLWSRAELGHGRIGRRPSTDRPRRDLAALPRRVQPQINGRPW
jgi:hypothetical protein